MKTTNVALFGCGTVGAGVARMLLDRGPLTQRLGDCVRLKYIVDARLDTIRRELQPPRTTVLTDDLAMPLRDPDVQVVVELFGGTTTAREVVVDALRAGKDVVTANKALLAEQGHDLYSIAREEGRSIAFGASVCGGIPIIAAIREGLIGDDIESIYGIVNGTCNYVLTRMLHAGLTYDQALEEAQELGYAEADPSLDVDGIDSAHKLAILARLAFGANVEFGDIPCEGIADVQLQDLRYAQELGYRLKLLAIGRRADGGLELHVHPALVRESHPLAGIGGVFNAVCIYADQAGEIVLTGQGAGRKATSSAVVADIVRVAMGTYQTTFASLAQFGDVATAHVTLPGELRARYYVRLDCLDRAGVLAQVAGVLGEEGISIASVRQQEGTGGEEQFVPVVFMTHVAREDAVCRAVDGLGRLPVVHAAGTRILRVEDIEHHAGEWGSGIPGRPA